ncbi:dynamin [Aspergillus luchuensis IFO 4308]|nr:dynamin [Aspergillus luchuensis IFO 4308]
MTVKLEAQIEVDSVLAEPALLEEIDRLFACNVGEYINLPQLVVVGDQSSGKSSVLEGLTKLKSPRNTGLCTRHCSSVVPANVDIATQEIIEIARELDPDGIRTLRCLTKPDLVDEGAEEKIIDLNLGQKDLQDPSKDRDIAEGVFRRSPPWNRLSKDNYGIEALRARLQALLASNVRRKFPSRITENALQTKYGSQDAFDDEPELRLATLVANRNALFSDQCNRAVASPARYAHLQIDHLDADDFESEEGANLSSAGRSTAAAILRTSHMTAFQSKIRRHKALSLGLRKSIECLVDSKLWPSFAEGYICDIIYQRLGQNILSFLLDELSDKYRQALSKTNFLLRIERESKPMTQNHCFNSNLQKCRQERITSEARKSSVSVDFDNDPSVECVRLSDLTQIHHVNNMEQTVQDIHDILKLYYNVARKRFIDNMCMQAADFYLVTGPEAPMRLFSPAWVYDLSPERLNNIVGEGSSVRRKRKQLRKQLKDLETGQSILV